MDKECEEESKINEYIDNLYVISMDVTEEIDFDIRGTGIVPVYPQIKVSHMAHLSSNKP